MHSARASLLALITVLCVTACDRTLGGTLNLVVPGIYVPHSAGLDLIADSGSIAGADYTIWASNFDDSWVTFGEGDADGDRLVAGADYTIWADGFGPHSYGNVYSDLTIYGYGYSEVDVPSYDRVYTAGLGGRVWGDYKENSAADPNADRYYIPPRRRGESSAFEEGPSPGAEYTIWADFYGGPNKVNVVPEPSSIVLGGLALAGMLLVGLRGCVTR